jgi:DNA-binding MarR family transcriptional regulator
MRSKVDHTGRGFVVRSILAVLRHNDASRNPNGLNAPRTAIMAREIGRTLDCPMSDVNAALKVLRRDGLVRDRRRLSVNGKRLPREYRLTEAGLRATKAMDPMVFDDDYGLPYGCTGHYREDVDHGDVLTHTGPCEVHPVGCALACQVDGVHTREPGCQLHVPPAPAGAACPPECSEAHTYGPGCLLATAAVQP